MRAGGKGRELVDEVLGPGRLLRQRHIDVSRFDGRRDRVDARELAAQGIDRDAEHLPLQGLDDGRAVGLVLDQHAPGRGIELCDRADGRQRAGKVQVPVEAIAQVVVFSQLAPDLHADKVVVLPALEGGVHADDFGRKARDLRRVVAPPPAAPDEVSLLPARRALVQRRPGAPSALRIGEVGGLELPQPAFVLAQLRAEGLAGAAAHRVALLRLQRQAQQLGVVLRSQDPRGQVVLVPGRHDQDHLAARRQARFQRVLPFLPQSFAEDGGVGLLPVFHRIVDDDQLRRIAGDAGHDAAADQPSPGV